MEWLTDPQAWIALTTLTLLEIVLGIDNLIFISILAQKLPVHQRDKAQKIGLALAMITRVLLLFSLSLIMKLTTPWFAVMGQEISGRDVILIVGGLFLLGKSTLEIHEKLEGEAEGHSVSARGQFGMVLIQIMLLDIVFSLDSVITAIGLAEHLSIMIIAVIIAVIFMMVFVGTIGRFVERHPTIKILALSFLLLIGTSLIGEGLDMHIPKGYIYFAMAFSVFVETLNLKIRKPSSAPVQLHEPHVPK
jgi:predicted tellurium resistance membrane protein TerC